MIFTFIFLLPSFLHLQICIDYVNKLSNRILQSLMDVFPQVPPNLRKAVDEMTSASLLLFDNSVELILRRMSFTSFCYYHYHYHYHWEKLFLGIGFREMMVPLAQKCEKKILSGNYTLTYVN